MTGYQPHPYADLFPMMSADELRRLADDIRENGQHDAITTLEGLILDGRNRYKACQMAGVVPVTAEYTGDNPAAFVVSKNLNRRHLSDSQRAMLAAELANISNGSNRYEAKVGPHECGPTKPVTQQEAADLMDVGIRVVQQAKQVVRDGVPELAEMVKTGEVAMHTAVEIATLTPEEQAEVVEQGPEAVKAKASESRARRKQQKPEARSAEIETTPPQRRRETSSTPANAGIGLEVAVDAINVLMRIPRSDPQRKRAFEKVRDWLDHNL
jgi:hypothetical protein